MPLELGNNNYIKSPEVTVLMSVYNGEKYLRQAVESILSQSMPDFEFIIIDDGSNDNSLAIIRCYSDPRIRLIQNKTNFGLVKSLNIGIELAKGKYIARMDCDDVSLPERLTKQKQYLDKHPEVGVVGTGFQIVDENGIIISTHNFPLQHDVIRWSLCFFSPIVHPSVMMRKDVVLKVGKYDPARQYAQDYDLWRRLSNITCLANLRDSLLFLRKHDKNISAVRSDEQHQSAIDISRSAITMALGEDASLILVNRLWNRDFASAIEAVQTANLIHKLMCSFINDDIPAEEKRIIRDDAWQRIRELLFPFRIRDLIVPFVLHPRLLAILYLKRCFQVSSSFRTKVQPCGIFVTFLSNSFLRV